METLALDYLVVGGSVVAVLLLIGFVYWIFSLRRVVPMDEVHIVRKGSKTLVYGTPEQGNEKQAKQLMGNCYYHFPI